VTDEAGGGELAIVSGVIRGASWAAEAFEVWVERLEQAGAVGPRLWVEGDDVRFVFQQSRWDLGSGGDADTILTRALIGIIDKHLTTFWFPLSIDDLDDPHPDRF
jgi:hypothetical protein